ncbi:MAG: PASTA domain-containing protein [Thermodesulfovibrionales bacterium]|nr:PASTA domain-containing protein [Thermodesulfovibrionales bacterium]
MKRFIKIPLYIVLVTVFGIITGHITFTLLTHSKTVTVPDLKGKSMVDANAILKKNNLYIRLEGEEYDINIPQGHVMWQHLPPGSVVKEGREIGVMISKGAKIRYVPDVVGHTVDEAEALLRDRGIKITKTIYVSHPKIPKNTVIAQRPETHEKAADYFNIIVSAGIKE